MTYNPSDGISLTELILLVRRRLGDYPQEGYDTAVGDGAIARFSLTKSGIVADSFVAAVAGNAAAATLDPYSGWVTFTAPPGPGEAISFSYQYTVWSDERITEAINSAIDELFGKFYVAGVNDDIWSDGTAELLTKTSAGIDLGAEDRITRVEYWSGSRWVRTDRWRVLVQNGVKVIAFETTPSPGINFRISYVVRPGNLDLPSETLEGTAGLPTRAKEPIVLLSCSGLIVERMHHRIRDDRAHNTQGDNPVKSYEIQNDAQFLRAQAMAIMQSLKMDPLAGRVTL